MATLCIDTATEHGMVVVARDNGSTAAVHWRSSGRHAENLFGYIESALEEVGSSREELSLVGVDIGPGRFTSVRVGLATAKGLALGLGLPIVGVSSLRVLARSIEGDPGVVRVPVMNAYRGDVFSAAYEIHDRTIEELVAPRFGSPDEVFASIREAVGARPVSIRGEGVQPDALLAEVRYVMDTEGPADLVLLEPRYLRPSDAKLPDQPIRTDVAD